MNETRPQTIRIMVVDDHLILRAGIAAILQGQPDMTLIAEASNGAEAVERFVEASPDVTLMDLQMPRMNGVDAITAIRKAAPRARIIVLTTYGGDAQALRALRAGASGYLLKSALRKELLDTIRDIHAGKRQIPPEIAQEIAFNATMEELTEREVSILNLVAAGNANKEIGWQLSISEDTVKAHLRSIFAKLDASDRTQAVTSALRRGIIEL